MLMEKIVTCGSFSIHSGNVAKSIENYLLGLPGAEAKYLSNWFYCKPRGSLS